MQPPSEFRRLTDAEWEQLQDRADQFQGARLQEPDLDWEPFLPPPGDRLRLPVLQELIKIDLDLRWQRGEQARLEEYAARFPELGPPDELPTDLVYEEYRIRQVNGDKPSLGDYRDRFPRRYAELEKLVLAQAPATLRPDAASQSVRMTNSVAAPGAGPSGRALEGGYELIEFIDHGNFGEVWRGKNRGGVLVAVKIVTQPADREAARREREALELVRNIRHNCLLATIDFWVQENRLHIIMELADFSLRDRLEQCRRKGLPGIPAPELLNYFRDAAEGLDFLHRRQIFHRDVKPANVLVVSGHAKVADFGLARHKTRQLVSVSGSLAGTPAYMSPEVWGSKACAQSDQYSLALTYAEMRTGRRPIEGTDFVDVMTRHLEQPPDLSALPPAEQAVLRRALAKKPEQRYPSCRAFVNELIKASGVIPEAPDESDIDMELPESPGARHGTSGTMPVPEPTEPTEVERPRRKGWALALAATAAVALLGAITWFVFQMVGPGKPTRPTSPVASNTENGRPTTVETKPTSPVAEVLIPKGFAPAANAKVVTLNGKRYHDRIVYSLANGERAEFVLVEPDGTPDDPAPFYALENKVWNAFFGQFAGERPGDAGGWQPKGGPMLPATNVTAPAAQRFAHWIGGNLPTPRQWDKMAGYYRQEGQSGPGRGTGAAVGRAEPRPVNEDADSSVYKVRDLAGNGREWTSLVLGGGRKVEDARPDDLVVLRGRSFTLERPLTFAMLKYEQETPQTQYAGKGSPYTGFRVVLGLPE